MDYEPFIERGENAKIKDFSIGYRNFPIQALLGNIDLTTPLCNIMMNYGSDKGGYVGAGGIHNYTKLYYYLLSPYRNKNINFLEFGIGTSDQSITANMGKNCKPGASLYGWRLFFGNANIFGADVDRKVLFTDSNINTFYCDVTNEQSINNLWESNNLPLMDIILDDSVHEKNSQLFLLKNTFKYLKKDGMYLIEDVKENDLQWFDEQLLKLNLGSEFKFNSTRVFHPWLIKENNTDNCVVIIKKI